MGRIIFPNIGCTVKSSVATQKQREREQEKLWPD
jgi:hypothetical protein